MPKSVLTALVFSSCRFLGSEPILTQKESGNGARSPSVRVLSMPQADWFLFDDLDAVLRNGSPDKRVDMLRRVTDLFLSDGDRLNDAQIGVFDRVIAQLINQIETTPAEIRVRPLHRR